MTTDEYPKALYWQGGRSRERVARDAGEEAALNAEGWLAALPLDEAGNPVAPGEARLVELVAIAPKTPWVSEVPSDWQTEAATAVPAEVPTGAADEATAEPAPKPKKPRK